MPLAHSVRRRQTHSPRAKPFSARYFSGTRACPSRSTYSCSCWKLAVKPVPDAFQTQSWITSNRQVCSSVNWPTLYFNRIFPTHFERANPRLVRNPPGTCAFPSHSAYSRRYRIPSSNSALNSFQPQTSIASKRRIWSSDVLPALYSSLRFATQAPRANSLSVRKSVGIRECRSRSVYSRRCCSPSSNFALNWIQPQPSIASS